MTKRTYQRKSPVQAVPVKSETSFEVVEPVVLVDSKEVEDNTPIDNKAQKLIDELTAKNIIVPYPSDFSKWDDAFYARLEKLNK